MIRFLDDFEAAVISKLKENFPDVLFSTREPAKRPPQWVRIIAGGSDSPLPIHEAITLTVEVWDEQSSTEANALAQKIRRQIHDWGWRRNVYLSDAAGSARVVKTVAPRPFSYPPGDRWSRYTCTYQITLSRLARDI